MYDVSKFPPRKSNGKNPLWWRLSILFFITVIAALNLFVVMRLFSVDTAALHKQNEMEAKNDHLHAVASHAAPLVEEEVAVRRLTTDGVVNEYDLVTSFKLPQWAINGSKVFKFGLQLPEVSTRVSMLTAQSYDSTQRLHLFLEAWQPHCDVIVMLIDRCSDHQVAKVLETIAKGSYKVAAVISTPMGGNRDEGHDTELLIWSSYHLVDAHILMIADSDEVMGAQCITSDAGLDKVRTLESNVQIAMPHIHPWNGLEVNRRDEMATQMPFAKAGTFKVWRFNETHLKRFQDDRDFRLEIKCVERDERGSIHCGRHPVGYKRSGTHSTARDKNCGIMHAYFMNLHQTELKFAMYEMLAFRTNNGKVLGAVFHGFKKGRYNPRVVMWKTPSSWLTPEIRAFLLDFTYVDLRVAAKALILLDDSARRPAHYKPKENPTNDLRIANERVVSFLDRLNTGSMKVPNSTFLHEFDWPLVRSTLLMAAAYGNPHALQMESMDLLSSLVEDDTAVDRTYELVRRVSWKRWPYKPDFKGRQDGIE